MKKHKSKIRKLRLFALFFFISSSIFAAVNRGTSVTSDKLEVSFSDNCSELIFSGNVKLVTPGFSAECIRAKIITNGKTQNITSDFDAIKQISATGPLFLKQGDRSCSAHHAEITTADSTIILSGDAVITDPSGRISAQEIRVNYVTKTIEISGNSAHQSVTVALSPEPLLSDRDGPGLKTSQCRKFFDDSQKNFVENRHNTSPVAMRNIPQKLHDNFSIMTRKSLF